ncbi:MAG: site-2 protease family protein [Deltaproteobacteria bacterium]|nr:site-2 protease family protein [Deltaproteobacteria bacterium]
MSIGMDQIRSAILYLIAFILCIAAHEFGHAWVATRLGDPTPRLQGRLTLAPQHHIDPIGTILMPLIMAFTTAPLLAWGRPVQINPAALGRRMTMSTGRMLVAIAGPAMNLVMALVVSVGIVIAAHLGAPDHVLNGVFHYLVALNISLMIFNLLPIPPLDGGSLLAWLLPRSMHGAVDFLARYGGLILLVLVLAPSLGLPILSVIAYPIRLITHYWLLVLNLAVSA